MTKKVKMRRGVAKEDGLSGPLSSREEGVRTVRTAAGRRGEGTCGGDTRGAVMGKRRMRPPPPDLKEAPRQLLASLSPQQCLSCTPQFHSVRVAGLRSASDQWGDLGLEKS